MNEQEFDFDHMFGEDPEGKIPVNDKRRFNEHGERIAEDEAQQQAPPPQQPQKTPAEIDLEAKLKAEIERREAAEAKLIGVQAKFDEAKSSLEKETAEMRERLKKTLEDRATQSQFNFLLTLLPVLDNLNMAVSASEAEVSPEALKQGVIGTARSFEHALQSVGVVPVPSVGEVFDPELHEAVDMVETDPANDGRVTAEYSRGYKFGDRLLRAARVQVGKAIARSAVE